MTVPSEDSFDLARPLPATYWVVPGRLLVGEHPGSKSRADAMDRMRRFLAAGVTCFVDLTDPSEVPSYEALLPFATLDGRRVQYLREPIPDHGVPAGREVMARVLANAAQQLAVARTPAQQRRVLEALGDAALQEHAEWILMHRERPLEHNRLG